MVLKTNNDTCYFYCNDTKEKSKRFIYSPDLSLIYYNDEGEQKLDNVHIDPRTNVIVAKDNNSTYIIDDGYRNSMIRAGYLVFKDYDQIHINDKVEGNIIHENLIESITTALSSYNGEVLSYTENSSFGTSEAFYINKDGYKFTITIYDNINIVKINEERKINGLQFYPFDKNMDNYGTVYISIHCIKIDETESKNTVVADSILKHIIDNTEDIKYVSMEIKQPLYFTIGGSASWQ